MKPILIQLSSKIEEFTDYLKDLNRSPNTIKQYNYALNRILSAEDSEKFIREHSENMMIRATWRRYLYYQKNIGKISSDELLNKLERYPLPLKKGGIEKHNWYPKEKWDEILRGLSSRPAKMAGYIQLQFGLRIGELANLTVDDIDFNNMRIHVQFKGDWKPKGRKRRSIPMTRRHARTLKRWIDNIPSTVQHKRVIWSKHGKTVSIRTVQGWYQKANIKSHDLRRSFAKVLYYNSENDLYFVSRILGHSNINTTIRYLGLESEEVQEKFEKAMS